MDVDHVFDCFLIISVRLQKREHETHMSRFDSVVVCLHRG